MKLTIASSIVTILSLTAGVCSAASGITTGEAYVRSAPSIKAARLGSIKKGVSLEYTVSPRSAYWLKFQYRGRNGYIGKRFVAPAPAESPKKVVEAESVAAGEKPANPAAKPPVFEIVPAVSTEEIRLKEENAKQAIRISSLEKEVEALKLDVLAKEKQVARYHAMFPYIKVIESVESDGKDVMLNGIGKARMVESGKQVIFRLEGESLTTGERVMKGVAKERYQTGGDKTRVYYVLNSQSVKSTGTK